MHRIAIIVIVIFHVCNGNDDTKADFRDDRGYLWFFQELRNEKIVFYLQYILSFSLMQYTYLSVMME